MPVPSFPLPPQGNPDTNNSVPHSAQELRNHNVSETPLPSEPQRSQHPYPVKAQWTVEEFEAKLNSGNVTYKLARDASKSGEKIGGFDFDFPPTKQIYSDEKEIAPSKRPASRGSDTLKIVVAASLVVLPIAAFTITILWIVFTKRVGKAQCPIPDLCPGIGLVNVTSAADFYIDFPAARLAFVSSLSSTVSFTLVSAMMTMYAYLAARQLLAASHSEFKVQKLPSSHQTSIMLRMLNADVLVLWTVVSRKLVKVFWQQEATPQSEGARRTPSLLRDAVLVFLLALLSSAMIQAADTYLHIASDSVNLIQTQTLSSASNIYSRGLASWCLNRPSGGANNKDFWGCGITVDTNSSSVGPTNRTLVFALSRGLDAPHEVFNFTDTDGTGYAVIGPSGVSPDIDWIASSYALSSTCQATPALACNMSGPQGIDQGDITWTFSCNSRIPGRVDLSGNFTNNIFDQFVFDNHKYLAANPPFSETSQPGFRPGVNKSIVGEVTEQDVNETFNNPWQWAAMVGLGPPDAGNGAEVIDYVTDPRTLTDPVMGYQFLLIHCNTTVYDITYTAQNQAVTSILSKSKSNGTVAGISSMPAIFGVGMDTIFSDAAQKPLFQRIPFDTFVQQFALGQSRSYAFPLASQMEPRDALAAQQRVSKLVTKLPVASLWLLVVANSAFVGLGLALGVAAWLASRKDGVGQVAGRLGIGGLVGQLFTDVHEGRGIENENDLSEKNKKIAIQPRRTKSKGVAVELLENGGSRFVLRASDDLDDMSGMR